MSPKEFRHLLPGEQIEVSVRAEQYWNDTGLLVDKGDTYRFEAQGWWWDMFLRSDADGYATPWWSLTQWLGARWRRLPADRWFVLGGELRPEGRHRFAIGASAEKVMPATGRLGLFANDVPYFYWNNRGALTATVRRVA